MDFFIVPPFTPDFEFLKNMNDIRRRARKELIFNIQC